MKHRPCAITPAWTRGGVEPLPLLLCSSRSKSRLTSSFLFAQDEGLAICSTHLPPWLSKHLRTSPVTSLETSCTASVGSEVVRGSCWSERDIRPLFPPLDTARTRRHARERCALLHLVSWYTLTRRFRAA